MLTPSHSHSFRVNSPEEEAILRRGVSPRPPVLAPTVTDTKHNSHTQSQTRVQTHIWHFCREGRGPGAGNPGLL